jgi:predicted SAM-dependent methyltransferase
MTVSKLHHRIPFFGRPYSQRNEAREQRDQAIMERDEARGQRDQALREQDKIRRERDQVAGLVTFQDPSRLTKRPAAGASPPAAPLLVPEEAPAFDLDWYLAFYPDVAAAGIDAFQHYMAHGKGEGRYPTPAAAEEAIGFDRDWYLAAHPDAAAAGHDPFQHWLDDGKAEGRHFNAHFSFSPRQLAVLRDVLSEEVDFGLLSRIVKNAKGTSKKECPICGFSGCFRAFGNPPRWDAQCPSCGSLERHRLFGLVWQRESSILTDGAEVLHFAPEPCVRTLLTRPGIHYTTADLNHVGVDLQLNIEEINLNDEQFDVIVCNHVLEHVNDRKALSELHRILKSSGVLIIMVPIREGCETTYEDDSIKDSQERLIHFGQEDHMRIYGADFIKRLTDAGFQVRVYAAFGKEAVRFGLFMGEKIFLCSKIGPIHPA